MFFCYFSRHVLKRVTPFVEGLYLIQVQCTYFLQIKLIVPFYSLAKMFLFSQLGVHLLFNDKGCNNLENVILLGNAVVVIV